jgi:ADP-heptose:LPS heptosyltransferase
VAPWQVAPDEYPDRAAVLAVGYGLYLLKEHEIYVARQGRLGTARERERFFVAVALAVSDRLRSVRPVSGAATHPLLRAGLERILERNRVIRTQFPVGSDAHAASLVLEATCLREAGKIADAVSIYVGLVNALTAIRSMPVRERATSALVEMSLGDQTRCAFAVRGFLRHVLLQRGGGGIGEHAGRTLDLLRGRPTILRRIGFRRIARYLDLWTTLERTPPRPIMKVIGRNLFFRLAPSAFLRDSPTPRDLPPRVTRAMGGAGDLLMMTPGLRALARRSGQPVSFAIPSGLAVLFEANPDVHVVPIEALPADWAAMQQPIDLTDCPAAFVESRQVPNVTRDRIEIFATAMGALRDVRRKHGMQPFFKPDEASRREAVAWLGARGLEQRPFVLIQLRSADSYKDYPHMPELARALAAEWPVVVVHDSVLPGFDVPGVHPAFGLPLGVALAIGCLAACIIAPDSVFAHLAGARDLPLVALYGPTDGKLFTRHYAKARIVTASSAFPCMPCWRNQLTPCLVTGGPESLCMRRIAVASVVDAACRLMRGASGFRGERAGDPKDLGRLPSPPGVWPEGHAIKDAPLPDRPATSPRGS